jgi:methylenetetrahydrofolate reductase (NADPH)
VEDAVKGGHIHAVSLTDNPGGHPALAPDLLGVEIAQIGMTPIVHFTGKDRNRNQVESLLYGLDRAGIRNILVMTGDYPQYGFEGEAKPVFDLDSVHILHMIGRMNEGLEVDGRAPGGGSRLAPTHFFPGCVVSPFKRLEAELMPQYYKLSKKMAVGASFIITQVGFDPEKFREVFLYVRQTFPGIPLLGNVYILNRAVARVMNKGLVPGCAVSDRLLREYEKEAGMRDKGRKARLLRGAKLLAIVRGLGFNGAHLGGPGLNYEDVEFVIDKSKELHENWQEIWEEVNFPERETFYLYPPGKAASVDRYAHLPRKSIGYAIMKLFHSLVFLSRAPFYRPGKRFFHRIERTSWEKVITVVEYWIKFLTSRCRKCGDCTLLEVAFLCPQSQCPKFLFNGACGGSWNGWCEVYPNEKKCIYVRAYQRLKPTREDRSLSGPYTPPRNWALDQTSSWINFFLGKDHHGGKL